MVAYLTDKWLVIKSGTFTFSEGKLPKEEKVFISADHPQFDKAVEWAKGEGLL